MSRVKRFERQVFNATGGTLTQFGESFIELEGSYEKVRDQMVRDGFQHLEYGLFVKHAPYGIVYMTMVEKLPVGLH